MIIKNRLDSNFKEEENRLQILERRIAASLNKARSEITSIQFRLKTERDPTVIKKLNNEIVQYQIDSHKYERCKPNPYYARVSFLVNGKEETYVIGKEGLNDYLIKGDILVVDWRADLARIYNQKTQTEFQINGEPCRVTLRRGVKISNTKLVSINNEYLSNENAVTTSKSQKTSELVIDPFLLEVLEDQRRQNAVTDIIATIQENQNKIITQPYDKSFIVQGCSGSGKTMILLHRLSYLLFNKLQDHISQNSLRIITPNKGFILFINDLVHQLGLNKIPVMPIEELYEDLIKRVTTSLDADKPFLSDSQLPSDLVGKYYSDEFLAHLSEKYNEIWNQVLVEIRESDINGSFTQFISEGGQHNYRAYQSLSEIHHRSSAIAEKINREIVDAKEKLKNAPTVIRMNIEFRLKQIPTEAARIADKKVAALTERRAYLEKLNKNLEVRDRMNAYLDYETFTNDSGSKLKQHIQKHAAIIIQKIQDCEKELANIPEYAFVQRLELNGQVEKLKQEYKKQVYTSLEEYFQKFEEWQKEIERLNQTVAECDLQMNELADLESSLNLLQERITSTAGFDFIPQNDEYSKWKIFTEPYFKAKKELEEAESRREENTEYRNYLNIGKILDKLKPELLFKNAYESAYLPEISGKRTDKEQFHFELFLKLYFCMRYFGKIPDRMFINIDEGQTLYISEYKTLQEFLGKDSVFNIYGDINQKVDHSTGVTNWKEISSTWNIFVLNENYRNTRQVTDYCNRQFHAGLVPIGIEGPDVEAFDLGLAISKIMAKYNKNPKERYAIIWDGSRENRALIEERIKGYKDIYWGYIGAPGVYVLSAHNARGLEFENVVVFDKDMSFGGKYIAYTRAMSWLIIAESVE